VTVYRGPGHLEPLAKDAVVDQGTAYAVGYRNLGPGGGTYLMVFAQDADRAVHWIAPAWLDPASDPASVQLAHSEQEALPLEAMVLDRPAGGALHVFTLTTPAPLHVSDVEAFARTPLDAAGLRALWPGAVVDETVVEVGASGDARPSR
jgi:hypothetical protein